MATHVSINQTESHFLVVSPDPLQNKLHFLVVRFTCWAKHSSHFLQIVAFENTHPPLSPRYSRDTGVTLKRQTYFSDRVAARRCRSGVGKAWGSEKRRSTFRSQGLGVSDNVWKAWDERGLSLSSRIPGRRPLPSLAKTAGEVTGQYLPGVEQRCRCGLGKNRSGWRPNKKVEF